jgi:hypothetical protein
VQISGRIYPCFCSQRLQPPGNFSMNIAHRGRQKCAPGARLVLGKRRQPAAPGDYFLREICDVLRLEPLP